VLDTFAIPRLPLRPTVRWTYTGGAMRSSLTVSALALVGLVILAGARAPAEIRLASNKERRFFSAREGVGVEAPPGWTMSRHTGYPTVLVAFVHPGGSRISLAVDRTTVKDAAALVEQSRAGLTAQGLTVDRVYSGPHSGAALDARSPRRNQALRQLYVVRSLEGVRDSRQAIVLTLAAPADQLAAASGSFDWVLTRLTLESPVRPDDRPDGGR
jgi:hypothetical protein